MVLPPNYNGRIINMMIEAIELDDDDDDDDNNFARWLSSFCESFSKYVAYYCDHCSYTVAEKFCKSNIRSFNLLRFT